MIKEAYCSLEISKLLKEKGFNEPVYTHYEDDNKVIFDDKYDWNNSPMGHISAPTHQMAMRWLREEKKIFIEIHFESKDFFVVDMYDMVKEDEYGDPLLYAPVIAGISTYEEAVETSIKYILEKLL